MTAKFPDWMGKYPRKGADWSPEEDTELQVRYGFGRTVAELADHHLREPIAITRRLALLRDRQKIKDQYAEMKTWRQEQDTARRYLNAIMLKHFGNTVIIPLTDLPPEVAQALQFGEGGES